MKLHNPVRLFSVNSILILGLVSFLSLGILFPSKTTLLKLLEASSTADVSLVFLKELYIDDDSNPEILLNMAKNYVAKGDFVNALEMIEQLLLVNTEQNEPTVLQLYINTLIEHNNQSDGLFQQRVIDKIEKILIQVNGAFPPEFASFVATTLIGYERPDIAFRLLKPHADETGVASYDQLISLALQTENFSDAIAFSLIRFNKQQTLENSTKLFDILISANDKKQMTTFVSAYQGVLSKELNFLQSAIKYTKKIGDLESAQLLIDKLLVVQPSAFNYTNASELAVAQGNLRSAAKYLQIALKLAPTAKGYIRLNQIYRWLGDILLAQRSSIKSVELEPTETSIRSGIDESKALGDLLNKGMLYTKLSENNFLQAHEYDDWIDAIEKGIGFNAASENLAVLLKKRPNDGALISHAARLFSYTNSYQLVVNTLNKLSTLRMLTYAETQRAAHAYIMLDQTKNALSVMQKGPRWEDAPQDYIEMLASLAYETSERELAIKTQQHLQALGSSDFNKYQYIRLLSPINAENVKQLLPMYNESKDTTMLLSLLNYAFDIEDKALFNQLIEPTLNQKEYATKPNILIWQAKYYELQHQDQAARETFLKILALEPNNESALNNLIWFALNKNESKFLQNIYHRIKDKSASMPSLWLAMASVSEYLGLDIESLAWYRKLLLLDNFALSESSHDTNESIARQKSSPAVLLNYANLLQRTGNNKHAYAIRKYLFAHKSAQIIALPEGDISHRSLVSILISPSIAKQMLTNTALRTPSQSSMVALYAQNLSDNQAHKVLFWQQQKAFSQYLMPDWQQMSLAILAKDTDKINQLLNESAKLSAPDRYVAYHKVARQQEAWQLGESTLGSISNVAEQRLLRQLHASEHPIKTHSVSLQQSHLSAWDINRTTLEYLAPHQFGNWRLNSYSQQISSADPSLRLLDQKEIGLSAVYLRQLKSSVWQLKLDLADGIGSSRLGVSGEYTKTINDYGTAKIFAGLNLPNQFSRLMYLAGKEDTFGIELIYRPTARESLNFTGSFKDLSNRFGEDIGDGWGINLRFNEQLFFNDPAFLIYADINIQSLSLKEHGFDKFNNQFATVREFGVTDFAQEDFQRFSLGQRIENGLAGAAGRTKPSPSYWLDTSVGYNNISKDFDFTISAGLGWRILGDDELYFKLDWQSADRNGQEYSSLSLGYIYGF